MKLPFLKPHLFPSTASTARSTAFLAAIAALFFVAAMNSARAEDSTTNTNEVLFDPYFGSFGFGDTSGSFGTLSLGGGGSLDGGGGFTSQAVQTVTYVQQTGNLAATFTSGTAGAFNQGSTEIGMYANGGAKEVAVWRDFKTAGDNTGSARSLQVGDVFTVTVYGSSAYGSYGFSLNDNGTQGSSFANRISGSRLYVQAAGTTGSWEVNRSGGFTSLNYNVSSTFRNYTFEIYITSETTANVQMLVEGVAVANRAFNITMNGAAGANIDAFSLWLNDDWNGSSNSNIYWKQETTVENRGEVELGYYLASGTFDPGKVTDGLEANSTGTASVNAVKIGGDSGSAVLLNQENTYTGATTVNAAATARASHNNAFGTIAGGVSVISGGVVELSGNISIGAEALTLNGAGISDGGALRNTSGNNSWAGAITLSSGARINSDAGTLTISGNINNSANQTLFVGGAGNTTINGTLNGSLASGNGSLFKNDGGTLTLSANNSSLSGLIRLRQGTISITNANSLGSGALELGNGSATATLLVNSNTTRTSILAIANDSTAGVIEVASGQTYTQSGNLIQTNGAANTTKFGKAGGGTLLLSGTASTYGGQIQIGNGTLTIAANNALSTNTTTTARGVDLGLNVGDVSQGNDVALLGRTGVTISNSIYVAPNTSSKLRTIGLDGEGTTTFNNEIYLDGTVTVSAGANGQAIISGRIIKPSAETGGGLTKVGAGTVTLSGSSANTYVGLTTVSNGVLELAKSTGTAINGNLVVGSGTTDSAVKLLLSSSDQVASSGGQTVTLSGGTIARGGNVSEVFGNLNLTTASFLDFGAANDAGTIRFGTYTPSALLTVNNFGVGNTLTFGSDLTSTINNGSLFSFDNGFTSNWNSGTSTFTITAIPEPSTYLAAAGLLAMFLWPVRRRLLKDAMSILGLRPNGRDRIEFYRNA